MKLFVSNKGLKKLFIHGGPGSGHRGHKGKPGQVGGSTDNRGGMGIKTLREIANVSLPPDNGKYEYFYHSVRYPSELDNIEQQGIRVPGKSIFLSKDEIRDRGSGFSIVRIPKGKAEESVDVVESNLSYRQWTVNNVPSKDIVRIVREVPYGSGGHSIREDKLAEYALSGKATDEEIQELPKKYQEWFK